MAQTAYDSLARGYDCVYEYAFPEDDADEGAQPPAPYSILPSMETPYSVLPSMETPYSVLPRLPATPVRSASPEERPLRACVTERRARRAPPVSTTDPRPAAPASPDWADAEDPADVYACMFTETLEVQRRLFQ